MHQCSLSLQSIIIKRTITLVALACRAPEKLGQDDDSRGECGPAVDVWALGILMLQLVTSDIRQPYPGKSLRNMFTQVSADL